ncbi:hypothetical protein PR048_003491 [Dryococelus australis]|uniref:Uncharacterized protein n=1 Tax=Dryococelus australis TaxID=614101 RepID=A0ABQ9IP72_9NEOP|nr:hypothetical protein PR048_003491 [Dryococelus australis]
MVVVYMGLSGRTELHIFAGGAINDPECATIPCTVQLSTDSIFMDDNACPYRAALVSVEQAGMQGQWNRKIPEKPAKQRHHPARFSREKIRERPRRESNPVRPGSCCDKTQTVSCALRAERWYSRGTWAVLT